MKILIIRFSSIGDIVLTSPVVRCIKKQIPPAEIHYLTKSSYKEIIEHNPYIAAKHFFSDDLSEIIPDLKKEKFDFIIDLQNNFRSLKLRMALRRKSNVVNKINFEKLLYVLTKWNIMPKVHIVDRYLEAAKVLGVKNDGAGLDYFTSPADQISVENLPLTHIHGFVAIAIGAKHNTKKLPLPKLKSLVREIHLPIILLGGKEDFEAGEQIRQEDPIKIFNGCGKFSLNQSASIVKLSKLVITHDTGLMHVAAAYGKKIISLWGNTVPEFGMYSYLVQQSNIVEVKNLWCRPCSKLGWSKCPLGHFKCMNLIDEKNVAKMIG